MTRIEHNCGDDNFGCVFNRKRNTLIFYFKNANIEVEFCPFCGYSVEEDSNRCGHFLEPDGSCAICPHLSK